MGDRVVVNRLAYRLGDPGHGQVVVFLRPTGADQPRSSGPISWVRRAVAQGLGGTPPGSEDLIKRVRGCPATVEGRDGHLIRNGGRSTSPTCARHLHLDFDKVRIKPTTLDDGRQPRGLGRPDLRPGRPLRPWSGGPC